MIVLLCLNVHPAKPPMSAPPWGNESHRVITHCKMRMSLLFIAALKQTVPSLLLSVLEEIHAFLKTPCLHLILPPPRVVGVSSRSRKKNRTQPESTRHEITQRQCFAPSPALLQPNVFSPIFIAVGPCTTPSNFHPMQVKQQLSPDNACEVG